MFSYQKCNTQNLLFCKTKIYLTLLNEHKSRLKRSRQILKMVIDKRKYTLYVKLENNGGILSERHEMSND